MNAPLWLAILLLGAAAWSTFQLFAFDDLLDPPRRYVLRLGNDWVRGSKNVPEEYRLKVGIFLTCPYCAGFWIWVIWLAVYWVNESVLYGALLMGGRGMVVAGHKLLAKEEDK